MEEDIYIPDGWTISSFGDNNFKIISSGVKHFDNSKDYLSTSSIERDNVLFVEEQITFKNRPSRANMQPIENSIWFAKMKNTLKIFYPKKDDLSNVILSTGFCGIYSSDVEISLIKQILLSKSFNSQKDLLAEGSTQEAVNNFKVKQIKFLLPENRKEQSKIAEILSKVDKAISETEIIIAKYNRIKTGFMQDLLTKGIDEKGSVRSEETHEFKDSPLGRIPKEWSPKKLNDCINKSTTITYGIVQTYEHIESGIPVLRTIDLKENGLNSIDNLLRTKKSISDMYKRTLLLENDIVCNVRASVGDFNIVNIDYVGCNTTRGVARICPSNEINNNYLLWFLKSYRNEKQMDLLVKGTTFIDINIADLRMIIVLLPSKTEQDLIADKLDKIQTSFHKYNTELSKLKSIKKGLMQDLLSGKKRVTHLIN